jgi:hypothetical protein
VGRRGLRGKWTGARGGRRQRSRGQKGQSFQGHFVRTLALFLFLLFLLLLLSGDYRRALLFPAGLAFILWVVMCWVACVPWKFMST